MNEFYPENNSEKEENITGNTSGASDTNSSSGYSFSSSGEYHGKPQSGVGSFENKSQPSSYTPPHYNYSAYSPYSQSAYTSPKKPPKKQKKKFSFAALIAVALCAAIIGGSFGVGGYIVTNRLTSPATEQSQEVSADTFSTQNININTSLDSVVEAVAKKCSPSVVGIRTTTTINSFFGNQESAGEGSGIIYTSDGYIITNYHVISDAAENSNQVSTKVEVFLAEDVDTAIPAEIVGFNISYDLAVLKIDKTGLPAIEVGDSDEVSVGQYAIAIGNPGGLSFMGSVSYGVVSGLSRTLDSDDSSAETAEYIQTDAAINPGNSGGALVNAKGQLIGVNSVKLVASGYEGMGFAIPVDKVVEICDDIISNEDEPTPYIGVEISTRYNAVTLQMYGFPVGAVVNRVDSGSPAEDAGLQRGDIITSFNGVEISDYTVFNTHLTQCKAGQSVEVTVYRSGRNYTTTIVIGSNG